MKIKDLSVDSKKLLEDLRDLASVENLPGYSQEGEDEYLSRTAHEWRVADPLDPSTELLWDTDCLLLAMIAYQALLAGESQQEVLDSVNGYRDIFYRGRLAMKYPQQTAGDPKYQDGLEEMFEICHILDPTYDPYTGESSQFSKH